MKQLLSTLFLFVTFLTFGQITYEDYQHYKQAIQGRFSSYPQTLIDTTKSDVLIRTKWIEETIDGYDIFYTQQGEFWKDKFYPYRQRIYKTRNEGTHILLEINTIDIPYDIMKDNEGEHPSFTLDIEKIKVAKIEPKQGCDIKIIKVFEKDNTPILYGETNDKDCVATFNGSTYTQVNFLILPNSLISWERGYNEKDQQVWGPEESPYIFLKVSQD